MIDQIFSFASRLRARARLVDTWLCVGIDPSLQSLPAHLAPTVDGLIEFCHAIIDSTAPYACSFKINFAFFEALGPEGWQALRTVRDHVPPEVPVIADAKRGDIASSAGAYADAVFNSLKFDAVTVNPYLGWDALDPFTSWSGKGVFALCRTSNPGAGTFQDLAVRGKPLYLHLAESAAAQTCTASLGLVVGATQPEALTAVRALSEDLLLLMPGIGAQGGDAASAFRRGSNSSGDNAVVAVSRDIIYASDGRDFADVASRVAGRRSREFRPYSR